MSYQILYSIKILTDCVLLSPFILASMPNLPLMNLIIIYYQCKNILHKYLILYYHISINILFSHILRQMFHK